MVRPHRAPTTVAQLSTRKIRPMVGRLPFSSSIPALPATPRAVPRVEKKSDMKNMSMKVKRLGFSAPRISSLNTTSPRLEKALVVIRDSGRDTWPIRMPMMVMRMMEISREPRM